MLYQIATLLLDVIGGLLTGACLLRLYMQWQRVPFPTGGALVFALTDWFIMPLRRLIPPTGQWDISSLVGLAGAAGAIWPAVAHCRRRYLGRCGAFAGSLRSGAGRDFGLDRPADRSRDPVLGADALSHVGCDWAAVRAAAQACAAGRPTGGRFGYVALVLLVLLQIAMIVLGHLQAAVLTGPCRAESGQGPRCPAASTDVAIGCWVAKALG